METLLVFLIAATSVLVSVLPVSLALNLTPKQRIFTLHCQTGSFRIKGGRVNVTSEHPDLYGLLVPRPVPNFPPSPRLAFTLEAIASSSLLCMTSRGRLYSRDSRSYKAKRTPPPRNCLWSEFKFSPFCQYGDARGIFSLAHSSERAKRFLSCPEVGSGGGLRGRGTLLDSPSFYPGTQELCMPDQPALEPMISVTYLPSTLRRVHKILDSTRFSKEARISSRVRRCIRRSSFFNSERDQRRPLKALIRKCKRRVRRRFEERALESENLIPVDWKMEQRL